MRAMRRVADAIDALTLWAGRLGALLVLAVVGLVFWNVVGRYLVGASSIALQEAEWHLLAPLALIGVASLMRENGHVRVDMVYERLGPRTRAALDLVAMLCGAAVAFLLIRYSAGFVESAWSINEGSPDPGGLPGRWALKGLLPLGFLLIALQCLANAVRALDILAAKDA